MPRPISGFGSLLLEFLELGGEFLVFLLLLNQFCLEVAVPFSVVFGQQVGPHWFQLPHHAFHFCPEAGMAFCRDHANGVVEYFLYVRQFVDDAEDVVFHLRGP